MFDRPYGIWAQYKGLRPYCTVAKKMQGGLVLSYNTSYLLPFSAHWKTEKKKKISSTHNSISKIDIISNNAMACQLAAEHRGFDKHRYILNSLSLVVLISSLN